MTLTKRRDKPLIIPVAMSSKVKLLDGSFTTQIAGHAVQDINGHDLWSSVYLLTEPDACVETHRDYIRGKCLSQGYFPTLGL